MGKINLLDCTLRDGGYINDWKFGNHNIVNIFERLVSSKVDIIEVGFLNENYSYDENRSILPNTESIRKIYGHLDTDNTMIVGMIDYGTCSIENIERCQESILDGIRVIFKKEKKEKAISFCKEIKELGYQVFAQAVSITSYDDAELMELLQMVNELEPYAFSLVDTYGLLHKKTLKHYFDLSDKYLKPTIGLGYHSHNNFQLAYANCIELIESAIERDLLIDGSLYGMGKSAGNAPIELLASYMNECHGKNYNTSQMLEAIDVTILDIYKKTPWGYSFKFFVSASNDCHPSYVSYLMEKKKLSVKSIQDILNKIDSFKKLDYDQEYIEELYIEYQKKECDDSLDINKIKKILEQKPILLLGPGNKIIEEKEKVEAYIENENPIVIAVNYLLEGYSPNYIFISNAKRYVQLSSKISKKSEEVKLIATSNVTKSKDQFDYTLSYSALLDEQALIVDNPMIMLIKLLDYIGVDTIALAGFDGYVKAEQANYVNPNMEHDFSKEKAKEINQDVRTSLERLRLKTELRYITTSLYHV